MKRLLLMILLFTTSFSFAQKRKDFLLSFIDNTSGDKLTGFITTSGDTVIKATYSFSYTDTFYKMAIVLKNSKWVGIDRNEKIILTPFIFDNGPDYVEEGLFRVVENNKIGFANPDGQLIIPSQFDFATPFAEGIAEYYLGGERNYEKGGEHWYWTGSYESGYINKAGQRFKKLLGLKNNKQQAWTKDNKHVILNKTGQIIFTYNK